MNSPTDIRFMADAMLGRLTKWLRVMGYDAHYPQPFYKEGSIRDLIDEGRLLLSRNRRMIEAYSQGILIVSGEVPVQLREMIDKGCLSLDTSRWFTRCLICNWRLEKVTPGDAKAHIPEYIFSQYSEKVLFCPSCKRHFWPGSHKAKILTQLSLWGIPDI